MKPFVNGVWIVLVSAMVSLTACGGGGGGGDGGAPSGTVVASSVTGFVATGSPVRNALVSATNGVTTVTARTDASGRYTLNNISQFSFPLTITAVDPARADQTLSTVVLSGQRVANITPATTALARILANGQVTASEIVRLSRVLQNSLANYIQTPSSVAINFFSDAAFRPDSTGVDAIFDLVEIETDGNNFVLTSRPNPALQVTVNPAQANGPVLVRPLDSEMVSPSAVAALVQAFDNAFRTGNLSVTNLGNVLHSDFQDDAGFRIENFAQVYNNPSLVFVSGFEILRCFPDATVDGVALLDRCQVRLSFARPLTRFAEDFGNSNFTQVIRQEFYDLELERRGAQSNPLKFSGGYYKPFAGKVKRIDRITQSVGSNGFPSPSGPIQAGVFIQSPASAPGTQPANFGELVNSNLVRADLVQRVAGGGSSSLFSVSRVAAGQCGTGTRQLVVRPDPMAVGGADCGNVGFGTFVNGLPANSKAAEVFVDLTQRIGQQNFVSTSRSIRIDAPVASTAADYPVLNPESLGNLFEYASNSALRTVVVTLVTPPGRQSVCLSTGLEPEPICVYGQRRLSLTPDQIGKASTYLLSTEDSFGNVIQRRYQFALP